MRRSSISLGVVCVLVAGSAKAQDAMVPREFATALLRQAYSRSDPDLFAGRLAGAVARNVKLPPGTTVLGTAIWPERTLVIAQSPLAVDSIKVLLAAELHPLGWTDGANMGGGFRPASMRYAAFPDHFCLMDTTLSVTVTPRGNPGSELRITESTSERGSCPTRPQPLEDRLTLPVLYDPSVGRPIPPPCEQPSRPIGVRMSASSGTMIRPTMAPGALLAHYGSQLEAAGWASRAPTPPNVISGTWVRQDLKGRTLETVLRVASDSTVNPCYQVFMETYRTSSQ